MPVTDLPYTYCSRKLLRRKDGSVRVREYWRFRRDGHDCPLPGCPGEPAFHARYGELMAQADSITAQAEPLRHTFAWLARQYLASAEFAALSPRTQDDYAATLNKRIVPVLGPERFDCINRATVKAIRDSLRAQPRTAHKIKQMTSRLYSWAEESDLLPDGFTNPAANIRRLKAKVNPIAIWSDDEVAHFMAHCPAFLKTPVLLALYTGQRREDITAMNWADYHGSTIRVRQNKTGEPLDIACHPVLRAHLDAIRTGFGGSIVRAANGRPMNPSALSAALNRAVAAVPEMPARSWHGLRYLAAGKLEESGCSVVQITSVIGHRTYQMAMQYMRQRRDAQAALAQLEAAG